MNPEQPSWPTAVDVAILGAGTAGLRAYKAVRAHTDRVVVIDPGPLGTTCARVGCMPSKLLLAAGHAAHEARGAWRFGADIPREPQVDGAAVMDRVRRERDRFVGFVTRGMEAWPPGVLLTGRARFTGPQSLDVDGHTLRARVTIVATGGRALVPPMFRALGDRMVVNDAVFDWTDLPASVAVFGPGIIGLELGQALHRLGVRVRMFGLRGAVGPITDPAVRDVARAIFRAELDLHDDADIHEARREGDQVVVHWTDERGPHTDRFACALVAVGRRTNHDDLGLDRLGVDGSPNPDPSSGPGDGPTIDPHTLQLGDHPIFFAGDVHDERPVLHEATDEGKRAGEQAVALLQGKPSLPWTRRSQLSVVFCEPGIALVGASCADLDSRAHVTGAVSFEDQGRSRVMLRNAGLLHVYADRATGRFLGAEMIGPAAEHLGHLLAWAHQQGLTVEQMLAMPFYHPVVEEGLRTALRDAASQRTPAP